MKKILLLSILLLGFFFRFNNLNWDENFHLHPDERFLTMVGNAMTLPKDIGEYFDSSISKLNPTNIGYKFFVYGDFPLILNKYLAFFLKKDNYNDFTILGRQLSAFFDFLIIVLVFKSAQILLKILKLSKKSFDYLPIFATFFYAISVYPIQSSHFFTTDTFLNFFMFLSFYLTLRWIQEEQRLIFIFLSAIVFGMALACKISAIYILPLIFALIAAEVILSKKKVFRLIFLFLFFLLFSYLSLRLFNPYYFVSGNIFDIRLNPDFLSSIGQLKDLSRQDIWYPPGVQWINKPWWGLLSTTFFAGLGPVNFIVMLTGIGYLIFMLKKGLLKRQLLLLTIIFWTVGYFIYQSAQTIASIRYTIYLYPFYAIFAGMGILVILNWLKKYSFRLLLFFLLIIWPVLFSAIYFHKNTRVLASEWIYQNLPNNAIILGEHWDDPLPLPVLNPNMKTFSVELLPIFDPDTKEKWGIMRQLLQKGDYYVLSSNRGWGSIPTVPERYPIMSQFYQALLTNDCQQQNKLVGVCYQKIKTFEPYYYRYIRYPDSWIEETFTVYDHQTVMIYKKI
jgi:hypothetical protein